MEDLYELEPAVWNSVSTSNFFLKAVFEVGVLRPHIRPTDHA